VAKVLHGFVTNLCDFIIRVKSSGHRSCSSVEALLYVRQPVLTFKPYMNNLHSGCTELHLFYRMLPKHKSHGLQPVYGHYV